MKYENAKDLLPAELLAEVQKYAAGKLLYVPTEETKGWGTASGYRQKLLKRNQTIYNEYAAGKTILQLADEYFLSTDSIKKIVYGKKNELIPFKPSTSCAMQYSEAGLAEEWIRAFCVERMPEAVTLLENYIHFGIVKMPLRLIEMPSVCVDWTCVDCTCVEETEVEPLLIRYMRGKFYLLGQETLLLSLKQKKINAYPVFILITDREEHQDFMKNFGKHFLQAR